MTSTRIPLHRLILSISKALDQVHPRVVNHQNRVAYIATQIARRLGVRGENLVTIFQAAALHDIGLITPENRVAALKFAELERVSWHAEIGYELLKTDLLFSQAAEVLRYHHRPWADGRGAEADGRQVPLASHILTLADSIETSIDRNVPILEQVGSLTKRVQAVSGSWFHPRLVEIFLDLAAREAFWLDLAGNHIQDVLQAQIDWPILTIDEASLCPTAAVFARLVDLASPWTAVHSAGVAATAVALSQKVNFSPREQQLMRSAGYLHDIGKLSVSSAILDKPGKLTREEYLSIKGHTYHTYRVLEGVEGLSQIAEWAAFHHERLDGRGYPFHLAEDELTLGSRIMAVADVFTAITEDRPYRKGMAPAEAMGILEEQAANGGLDPHLVDLLRSNEDEILEIRRVEQVEYGAMQSILVGMIEQAARNPSRGPLIGALGNERPVAAVAAPEPQLCES